MALVFLVPVTPLVRRFVPAALVAAALPVDFAVLEIDPAVEQVEDPQVVGVDLLEQY